VADPVRKLDRTRREARRSAADARALSIRARRRLDEKARARIAAACDEVDEAARDGDPERLSAALRDLDALWEDHLAREGKPLWRQYAEAVAAAVVLAFVVRAVAVEAYRIPSSSMAPTLLAGDHVLVSKLAYGVRVPLTRARLGGQPPRRGDVVVFESPRAPHEDLVKRVVGLPGDVVELRDEVLWVNGVPQPRTPAPEVAVAGDASADGACRQYREALARGPLLGAGEGDPAAREASWQAAAAAGVATHDVLQCRDAGRARREGASTVVRPGHLLLLGDHRDRSADGRSAAEWEVPLERVKGRVGLVFFSWGDGGAVGGRGPRFERLLKMVE
jgi:signal peptidase I